MDNIWTNPNDGRTAIAITVAANVVGILWWFFLETEPFHAAIFRLVPLLWLILAGVGCITGLRAVSFNRHRGLGALSMAICFLNIPLAGIFLLAATMGG